MTEYDKYDDDDDNLPVAAENDAYPMEKQPYRSSVIEEAKADAIREMARIGAQEFGEVAKMLANGYIQCKQRAQELEQEYALIVEKNQNNLAIMDKNYEMLKPKIEQNAKTLDEFLKQLNCFNPKELNENERQTYHLILSSIVKLSSQVTHLYDQLLQ